MGALPLAAPMRRSSNQRRTLRLPTALRLLMQLSWRVGLGAGVARDHDVCRRQSLLAPKSAACACIRINACQKRLRRPMNIIDRRAGTSRKP